MRWVALRSNPSPSIVDRILGKSVPAWVVVGITLIFALGAVTLSWSVKRSAFTRDETPLGQAALAIASFPTETKAVFMDIGRMLSGVPDYYEAIRAYPPEQPWSEFVPVKSRLEGVGEGLLVRHGPGTPARGWRVIAGALQVRGSLQIGAVLLSPDLEIVHFWPLTEDGAVDVEYAPPLRKMPHGLSVLNDFSVIYNFDGGASLHRKDKCGRTLWALPGDYHHSVTPDDTQATIWTHRDEPTGNHADRMHLVQVAVADGRIVKDITAAAIITANPDIDILELRRLHVPEHGNSGGKRGPWMHDPIHLNDIDPLPQRLADRFPMFAAGDLLISARELNLIFVMDPETLKVKWWEIGGTIRQHDGDWDPDGRISAFNNRMSREYSTITSIDPTTRERTVAVDGRSMNFYSRHRGSHQLLPNGNWLISSTQQGRIIEVAPNGDLALDFQNRLTEDKSVYSILTSSSFFPEQTVKAGAFQCGEN